MVDSRDQTIIMNELISHNPTTWEYQNKEHLSWQGFCLFAFPTQNKNKTYKNSARGSFWALFCCHGLLWGQHNPLGREWGRAVGSGLCSGYVIYRFLMKQWVFNLKRLVFKSEQLCLLWLKLLWWRETGQPNDSQRCLAIQKLWLDLCWLSPLMWLDWNQVPASRQTNWNTRISKAVLKIYQPTKFTQPSWCPAQIYLLLLALGTVTFSLARSNPFETTGIFPASAFPASLGGGVAGGACLHSGRFTFTFGHGRGLCKLLLLGFCKGIDPRKGWLFWCYKEIIGRKWA